MKNIGQKDIKIIVATHKKYKMPNEDIYMPIHVGREGKMAIGYIGDNTGENISNKNPYFCELTGLYWAWKNLDYEYIGLVHYRRCLTNKNKLYIKTHDKYDCILNNEEIQVLLSDVDVILPKKRKYYIESIYSHYVHTLNGETLDETRKVIESLCPDYLQDFDKAMNKTSAHMFNIFIMKKDILDKYCTWLFNILNELENRIDPSKYDAFHARYPGRISEVLLDVWINKNNIKYKEVPVMDMEKVNTIKKAYAFLMAKYKGEKYSKSF